jgi:hypothetical protein
VIEKTHGVQLQVSFGNQTALIYLWQVVALWRGTALADSSSFFSQSRNSAIASADFLVQPHTAS